MYVLRNNFKKKKEGGETQVRIWEVEEGTSDKKKWRKERRHMTIHIYIYIQQALTDMEARKAQNTGMELQSIWSLRVCPSMIPSAVPCKLSCNLRKSWEDGGGAGAWVWDAVRRSGGKVGSGEKDVAEDTAEGVNCVKAPES